jgi:chromosomal replication initiation ATPase DnaA
MGIMTDARKLAQLAFDLKPDERHSRADFVVSPANAQAAALIDRWPEWPSSLVILSGPEGSGKTHAASAWAKRAGAARAPASAVGPLADDCRALLIDPLDMPVDEHGLFHAINAMRARHGHILMTMEGAPADLALALPDLASRLAAATLVRIGPPDDALLAGMMAKLFADRQVQVDPDVIAYVASRMERSHAAALAMVDLLDAEALARKSRITKQLAGQVLKDNAPPLQPELFD